MVILLIGLSIPAISGAVLSEGDAVREPEQEKENGMLARFYRLAVGASEPNRQSEQKAQADANSSAETSAEISADAAAKNNPETTPSTSADSATNSKEPSEKPSSDRQESGAELPTESTAELSAPLVLILHTHTEEAYADTADYATPGRSENPENNMQAIGAALQTALAERGIQSVRCTETFDRPSVFGAYDRSWAAAEKLLAQYPSICWIIDLHRADDGNGIGARTTVNGVSVAQIGLAVGGGSRSPWQLPRARVLYDALGDICPQLCLPIRISEGGLGQEDAYSRGIGMLTVTCGNADNQMAEAARAATLLGEALAACLQADSSTVSEINP